MIIPATYSRLSSMTAVGRLDHKVHQTGGGRRKAHPVHEVCLQRLLTTLSQPY